MTEHPRFESILKLQGGAGHVADVDHPPYHPSCLIDAILPHQEVRDLNDNLYWNYAVQIAVFDSDHQLAGILGLLVPLI